MKLGLIIPTINRYDLLKELFVSLDKQVNGFDQLLVIDNGNQNIIFDDYHNMNVGQKWIKFIPEYNLGVGPSWNVGITYFRDYVHYDWVIIINDDVVLGDFQILEMKNIMARCHDKLLIVGGMWCNFCINLHKINLMEYEPHKFFDENLYPAYFEDNDFCRRLELINPSLRDSSDISPKIFRNSMTIEKDPSLNQNFGRNQAYYVAKWGGIPGQEKFNKPFNK